MYLAKTLQGLSSSKKKGSVMTYALSGRNKRKIEDSVVSKLRDQGLPIPGEVIEVRIYVYTCVCVGGGVKFKYMCFLLRWWRCGLWFHLRAVYIALYEIARRLMF